MFYQYVLRGILGTTVYSDSQNQNTQHLFTQIGRVRKQIASSAASSSGKVVFHRFSHSLHNRTRIISFSFQVIAQMQGDRITLGSTLAQSFMPVHQVSLVTFLDYIFQGAHERYTMYRDCYPQGILKLWLSAWYLESIHTSKSNAIS